MEMVAIISVAMVIVASVFALYFHHQEKKMKQLKK